MLVFASFTMRKNVLAVDLVIEHIEAVVRLCLRFQIQLSLQHPDLTWCLQAHRQSPHLCSFQSTPAVRALPFTGITRLPRSYDPFRLPLLAATLTVASELRAPPATDLPQLPRPPSRHAVLTTPVDRNRCLSASSLPARPSPNLSGVGIHNFTFEACSSFTRVTACLVAHQP